MATERTRSRGAFLAAASAFAACAALAASADAVPAGAAIDAARGRVRAVRVSHLADDLASAIAVGPASLAGHPGTRTRLIASPEAANAALRALARSAPRRAAPGADVRWAIALLDARGRAIVSASCDAFALDGYVGGEPVRFGDAAPLLAWLHAHDPA